MAMVKYSDDYLEAMKSRKRSINVDIGVPGKGILTKECLADLDRRFEQNAARNGARQKAGEDRLAAGRRLS
jgi:hypothetical protein